MRWRRESQIRMCITVVGWLFLPARCHPEALSLPIPKVENLWVEVNTESPSQLLTIGKTDSTEKMNLLQETDKKMNHHHPPFFLPSITTSVLQSQFLCILPLTPWDGERGHGSLHELQHGNLIQHGPFCQLWGLSAPLWSLSVFRRISCLLPKAPPLSPPPPCLPPPLSPTLIAH